MNIQLNEVDKIEILTLQDNYIDLLSDDSNDIIRRPMPLKSIIGEHGFSSLITVTRGNSRRSIIFDFGFSPNGAAYNADVLNVDYSRIEAFALSHGHFDHFGGMQQLIEKAGKKGIDFVTHPDSFRPGRCLKISDKKKIELPAFKKEMTEKAGVNLIETSKPYALLDGDILFLGQIPRKTAFEKGVPYTFYRNNGEDIWDDIPDDTSLLMNVKGKGLVMISGCAHAGIINSILYAKELAGVEDVFAVMGGFHLSGKVMANIIEPTIKGLKEINPSYVIPAHCTGRDAAMQIEKAMPDNFILNMAGTKLIFSA